MKITYSEYCRNKTARQNAGYSAGFYFINGEKLTEAEVDKKYPINGQLIPASDLKKIKGVNPDKRKNFLKDEKSYQ